MAGLAQVVEDCHQALKWLLPVVDRMPRCRRYSLGQQLEQHALRLLVSLSQAGFVAHKQPLLQAANQELVAVRHLWRLCFELELVAMAKYEQFSVLLNRIGQQIGGWLKRAEPAKAAT